MAADHAAVALRGGALRAGAYLAGQLLTLGAAALLFRHLGVRDTGRYVTVLSLVAVVQGLADAGLGAVGLREAAVREGEARRGFLRELLGLRLALVAGGIALAVLFCVAAGYDRTLVLGTLVAGAALLVQIAQGTVAVALQAVLRNGVVAAAELARNAVGVVAVIVLVLVGARLLPFFAAPAAGALVALVLTVRAAGRVRPAWAWRAWGELLRETLPFALASAVYVVYARVVVVELTLLADERQVGLFGAAFRLVEVLTALAPLGVSVALPLFARAAREDRERLARGAQRTFELGLLAGAGLVLVLVLGARPAMRAVGGDAFAASAPVLRLQALTLLASFTAAGWAYALLAVHAHRALLTVNLAALAAVGLLGAVLIPIYGARGAAAATTLAEWGVAAGFALALARHDRTLRPRAGAVPRILAAAGLGGAVVLIPGPPALVIALLAGAVYVAAAFALRAVPPELLRLR